VPETPKGGQKRDRLIYYLVVAACAGAPAAQGTAGGEKLLLRSICWSRRLSYASPA
jgi:hypothetical protein